VGSGVGVDDGDVSLYMVSLRSFYGVWKQVLATGSRT
jgi:hypothetical protein